MENIKHTPGPWNFHEQGEANNWCLLTNDKRWIISFLQNGELWNDEQIANAKIIAASPDLLEFCEWMKTRINCDADDLEDEDLFDLRLTGKTVKKLIEVINKATA